MRGQVLVVALVVSLAPSAGLSQTPGAAQPPGITITPLPPAPAPPPSGPAPQAPQPSSGGHGSPDTPPPPPGGDLFLAGPETYAPRFDQPPRSRRGRRFVPTFPYGVGGYVPIAPYAEPVRTRRDGLDARKDGYLRLRVTPASARVLIDNSYVGTVDEVGSRAGGLALEPGPHLVRIEASGHETATFEVEIVPREFVTYVRDLPSLTPPAAPPVASPTPKTFYVIPGCYAGDSPPQPSRLPEGCLTANLRTVPPVLNRIR